MNDTLDLDAIEAHYQMWRRARETPSWPDWAERTAMTNLCSSIPALLARVRALEAEVARLEACLETAVGPKGSTGWW
jgi:hypothetical protein